MKKLIVAIPFVLTLTACATGGTTTTEPQAKQDNEYVTGSNLPKRRTAPVNDVKQ